MKIVGILLALLICKVVCKCYTSIINHQCFKELNPGTIICPDKDYGGGLFDGLSTSLPLIEYDFIQSNEGLALSAYIPYDDDCTIMPHRGLTIGMGIDLKLINDSSYFTSLTQFPLFKKDSPHGYELEAYCKAAPEDCKSKYYMLLSIIPNLI